MGMTLDPRFELRGWRHRTYAGVHSVGQAGSATFLSNSRQNISKNAEPFRIGFAIAQTNYNGTPTDISPQRMVYYYPFYSVQYYTGNPHAIFTTYAPIFRKGNSPEAENAPIVSVVRPNTDESIYTISAGTYISTDNTPYISVHNQNFGTTAESEVSYGGITWPQLSPNENERGAILDLFFELQPAILINGGVIRIRLYTSETQYNTVSDVLAARAAGNIVTFFSSTDANTSNTTAHYADNPSAPSLVSPANEATITIGNPNTFEWSFNVNVPGDAHSALFERREPKDMLVGIPTMTSVVDELAFNHDDSLVALGVNDSADSVQIFNTSTWERISAAPILPGDRVRFIEFSNDGAFLVFGRAQFLTTPHTGSLTVLNTADWSTVVLPELPTDPYTAVAFHPNGTHAVVGGGLSGAGVGFFRVFSLPSWSLVSHSVPEEKRINKFSFNHDGSTLAISYGSTPPSVRLVDTATWGVAATQIDFGSLVIGQSCHATYSHDGALLLVTHSGSDPRIFILETATWQEVFRYTTGNIPTHHAFNPNDGWVVIGRGDVTSFGNFLMLNRHNFMVLQEALVDIAGYQSSCKPIFSKTGKWLALVYSVAPYYSIISARYLPEYWDGVNFQGAPFFLNSTQEEVVFPANAWGEVS